MRMIVPALLSTILIPTNACTREGGDALLLARSSMGATLATTGETSDTSGELSLDSTTSGGTTGGTTGEGTTLNGTSTGGTTTSTSTGDETTTSTGGEESTGEGSSSSTTTGGPVIAPQPQSGQWSPCLEDNYNPNLPRACDDGDSFQVCITFTECIAEPDPQWLNPTCFWPHLLGTLWPSWQTSWTPKYGYCSQEYCGPRFGLSCPPGPAGTTSECVKFEFDSEPDDWYGFCAIRCETNSDCPAPMECVATTPYYMAPAFLEEDGVTFVEDDRMTADDIISFCMSSASDGTP